MPRAEAGIDYGTVRTAALNLFAGAEEGNEVILPLEKLDPFHQFLKNYQAYRQKPYGRRKFGEGTWWHDIEETAGAGLATLRRNCLPPVNDEEPPIPSGYANTLTVRLGGGVILQIMDEERDGPGRSLKEVVVGKDGRSRIFKPNGPPYQTDWTAG